MFKELELSETDSVLAAYNAVCELVEDTERLQAACAAKEAELAALREQTAELFGARLEAEGMGEEAVTAAKAMWQRDPQSAAQAVLGCDIAEAANPYGCNQHGHEWRGKHGENWKPSGRGGEQKEKKDASTEKTAEEEADEYEKGTDDDRWVTLRKWKRERQEAKDKVLDIRDSSKYRQKDPEAIKAYEKAKDEANRRAKRIHEIIKIVAKRRGLSQRATDHMLRLYPETIIDF